MANAEHQVGLGRVSLSFEESKSLKCFHKSNEMFCVPLFKTALQKAPPFDPYSDLVVVD